MSIYSVTRRATPDEMGREIDRRGECIKKLETEIERLRAALKAVEWRCVGDYGETYCPVCNATEEEGHMPACMVLASLHPAPIQKEEK